MKKKLLAFPYVLWMVVFTVVPLLLFVYYAFTVKNDVGEVVYSLNNFKKFVYSSVYITVFLRSIKLAVISTVICLAIGYPTAVILSGAGYKKKSILVFLLVVPMWMNLLLRTYAWLTILENTGLLNTLLGYLGFEPKQWLYSNGSIVFGMVYNFLPFMILPIYNVLIKIDNSLIEAAQDLGAGPLKVFTKIKFPLSMPGVISGITMVFMPSVTTFAISSILSGRKINLIGNVIEEQFLQAYDWHFGSALSIVLLAVILLSMSFVSKYQLENEGGGLF